jgi:hypothetical protein
VSPVGLVALGVALFVVLPELGSLGWFQRSSPRLLGALQLAGLLGWALLPALSAGCLGVLVAKAVASGRLGSGGCWLSVPSGAWVLIGAGIGGLTLVPLVRQAVSTIRAVRRTELPALVRRVATMRVGARGGVVWVVPSARRAAYASGILRPVAVVTSAVLAPLGPDEQRAVVEHEAAHLRLGHPRILVLASVIERAYGALPPVQRRASALRGALEAAADDEAARVVGASVLLRALTRTILAANQPAGGFGDPEHLAARIERLQAPPRRAPLVDLAAGGLALVLVGLFAWLVCLSVSGRQDLGGEVLCGLGALLVAARPLRSARRSRPASHHPLDTTTKL